MKHLFKLLLRWLPLILLIGIAVFLFTAVRNARESAVETACRGTIYKPLLGLLMYHQVHGHLPPAYIVGPDGKPWHSWRVLILPYVFDREIYDRYHFDEPWNGPHNRLLADQIIVKQFQCPSGSNINRTLNTD